MSRASDRRRREEPGLLERAWRFFTHDVWLIEVGTLSGFRARATHSLRVVLLAFRGFFGDRCMQQAAALTYITIFSIVPMLAVVFATAKGFGADKTLRERVVQPFLDRTFGSGQDVSASSQQLRDAVDSIFVYVDQTKVGALGTFGVVLLLYLVVKMLGAVERSLNEIWGIKRARTVVRKLTDYLAILLVTPLFLVTGAGMMVYLGEFLGGQGVAASSAGAGVGGTVLRSLAGVLPLATIVLGFGFLLFTLPNTAVRFGAAALGGAISGALWLLVQYLHVHGQVVLAGWNPIYSSFAALPLLLLWIYLSWTILLLGAEFSCAFQNEPTYTSLQQTGVVDHALRESLAPRLAGRVAHAFLAGGTPPTSALLAADASVAPRVALEVLEDLVTHGILARTTAGEEEGYLPARDPGSVRLSDLLAAVSHDPAARSLPATHRFDRAVAEAVEGLAEARRTAAANHTLAELAAFLDDGEPDAKPGRASGQDGLSAVS